MSQGNLNGRWPAIVRSYNQARRTCRIEIPGVTNGASTLPEAEIEYAIGDKARAGSHSTEIEILPGDTVWVDFIGGDPRYPIITGYRNPQAGNSTDWRRIHHANIEQVTDTMMHLQSGEAVAVDSGKTITVKSGTTIALEAGSSLSLKVGGSTLVIEGGSITLQSGQINLNGPIAGGGAGGAQATFSGGIDAKKDVTAGGISLQTHVHGGIQPGGGKTGTPE